MTEPKWTPGPWRADENVGNGIPICAPFFPLAHVEGSVIHRYCTAADEEEKANARLIAAAPELYAALMWAIPLAEIALEDHRQTRLQAGHSDIGAGTDRIGLWPEEQDCHRKARAALAKARGEP